MDRMSEPSIPARGITLIEVFIALLILGVVISLGAPSLGHLSRINWLRAETSRLVASINLTRSEAVARNIPVTMCPSKMARTGQALCTGDFSDGWIVFSNPRRELQPGNQEAQLIRAFDPLPGGYTVTNRDGTRAAREAITYLPDGSSRRNRTLLVCPPGSGDRASRSVIMNMVGRPRTAVGWGRCPES